MKTKLLLIILIFTGSAMVGIPSYEMWHTEPSLPSPVAIVYADEAIPTPTAEPVPSPTPTPTIEPIATPSSTSTPSPTPIPTTTPFPKPDACFLCTNTWENRLNHRTSTGELVVLVECQDSVPLQNRAEVQAFMAYDTSYGKGWTCGHYARAVHNNAEANGIQCYLVSIQFTEFTHAIVMFPTIDDGDVYVDPQGADKWAYIPDDWNSYSIEFMPHVNTFTPGIITQPYTILSINNF